MQFGPSAGVLEGREHRLAVRVYYEDTDFSGVVYHASYARFFERGRSDFLRLIGVGHAQLLSRPDPCAFAITRLTIDFRGAGRIDDALTVRTRLAGASGARLVFRQSVERDDETLAEAEVVAIWIHPGGRARRPPRDLAAAIAPFVEPASP